MKPELLLASTSPRRAALLQEAGIPFLAVEPGVDDAEEDRLAASWRAIGLEPGEIARRLAVAKALAAERKRAEARSAAAILAADTVVVVGGRTLGKPRDRADARSMILALAGRTHEVLTGFALLDRRTATLRSGVETSRVSFRAIDDAALERFLASGAWSGKAGAYGFQDEETRELISGVEGSRSNVIGLPVERILELEVVRELSRASGSRGALASAVVLALASFLVGCPDGKATPGATPTSVATQAASATPVATPSPSAQPSSVVPSETAKPTSTVPDSASETPMKPQPFVPRIDEGLPQKGLPERALRIGGKTVTVELATTEPMRQLGLMHRDSMPEDHGMLFAYPPWEERFLSFWMKNTRIPLTVAFLQDDGTIVNMEDMEPQTEISHPSYRKVRLALEMNKGWFEVHGVKKGDKVSGLGDVLTLAE